jgi:hypothetical protein
MPRHQPLTPPPPPATSPPPPPKSRGGEGPAGDRQGAAGGRRAERLTWRTGPKDQASQRRPFSRIECAATTGFDGAPRTLWQRKEVVGRGCYGPKPSTLVTTRALSPKSTVPYCNVGNLNVRGGQPCKWGGCRGASPAVLGQGKGAARREEWMEKSGRSTYDETLVEGCWCRASLGAQTATAAAMPAAAATPLCRT